MVMARNFPWWACLLFGFINAVIGYARGLRDGRRGK